MDELKACHCGGNAKLWTSPTGDFIRCGDCQLTISYPDRFDDEKLIEEWNRRTQPENNPLSLEELRQMDGEIVYCTPLNDWGKITKYGLLFFGTEDYRSWKEIEYDYGKTWLAYAHKPQQEEK